MADMEDQNNNQAQDGASDLQAPATGKAAALKTAKPKAAPKAAAATPAEKAGTGALSVQAKAEPETKGTSVGGTVTVTQTGSVLGRPEWAEQTLIGLGLNKRHRTRTLEDTPAVRGMIRRVAHLVRVEDTSKKTGT